MANRSTHNSGSLEFLGAREYNVLVWPLTPGRLVSRAAILRRLSQFIIGVWSDFQILKYRPMS
jgi:hypothetical protein